MKLREFIAKTIREHLNENTVNDISDIIIKLRDKYSRKYNRLPQYLNTGYCEDIAYDVIEQIGGETSSSFIIDDGWFWSVDIASKYKTKGGEYWNETNLKKYGNPPFGYENLDKLDLTGHVWVFSNGKHYDVETINGVDNFWFLPIYQRQLDNLKLI